ncbi:MAG: Coenzyme F420 hydrogenase/dehydrogenase, beta subunit C-terminal domain [Chloroflexi bacterium]|nr:Coenzyme F420 hydrogenase/dehydrogenase, beta subunit C-terminal domain [Chloroflexota bacterium]
MITQLYDQVWTRDRCAGCAMCVAACSKQVLYWDDLEHPRLRKITKNIGLSKFELDTCSFCERYCEATCPRLEPAARLRPLAQMSACAIGALTGGEPNDVARNLLVAARGSGMIDGALMMDADKAGRTRARIVTSAGEIAETTGFQPIWTPLLNALNDAIFDVGLKNIAIVSTPCTAQAVRRLTDSTLERLALYRNAIRLKVAMFCTGVYQPDGLRDVLINGMNIAPEQIERLTASPREGKLRAQLWDGTMREMDLIEAEKFTRAGCARCDDYLGESADIAIGSVGAREGYSTVIARTPVGQSAIQNAVAMKLIETVDDVNAGALDRASAEKDKRERAQAFDALQIMALDALRVPRKLAEVKMQFDLLYGRPRPITKKEDYRNAGCGDCSGC